MITTTPFSCNAGTSGPSFGNTTLTVAPSWARRELRRSKDRLAPYKSEPLWTKRIRKFRTSMIDENSNENQNRTHATHTTFGNKEASTVFSVKAYPRQTSRNFPLLSWRNPHSTNRI